MESIYVERQPIQPSCRSPVLDYPDIVQCKESDEILIRCRPLKSLVEDDLKPSSFGIFPSSHSFLIVFVRYLLCVVAPFLHCRQKIEFPLQSCCYLVRFQHIPLVIPDLPECDSGSDDVDVIMGLVSVPDGHPGQSFRKLELLAFHEGFSYLLPLLRSQTTFFFTHGKGAVPDGFFEVWFVHTSGFKLLYNLPDILFPDASSNLFYEAPVYILVLGSHPENISERWREA